MATTLQPWNQDSTVTFAVRQPNHLLIAISGSHVDLAYAFKDTSPLGPLAYHPQIRVACLTPGARAARVVEVTPLTPSTFLFGLLELDEGTNLAEWQCGCHLFSIEWNDNIDASIANCIAVAEIDEHVPRIFHKPVHVVVRPSVPIGR